MLNRQASHTTSASLTNGRPVSALNWISNQLGEIQNTTGASTVGTVRVQYTASFAMMDVSFVFQCWVSQVGSAPILFGEQRSNLGPVTYQTVYLEYNGASYPLFFNGQSSAITMNPGALLVTDPYKIQIPAGATFFVRYFQTVPNNTFVPGPQAQYITAGTWSNLAPTSAPNIAANTGTTGLVQQTLYSQCMGAIGMPSAGSNPVVIGILGDSINAGFTTTNGYMSAPVLACAANGISFMMGACGGDYAGNEISDDLSRSRNIHIADCDAVVMNYGTNDLQNNTSTVAQLKGWLITLWQRYANYGIIVAQQTIVPRVTGTFTTVQGQTPMSAEANRLIINAWLRAPVSAGAGQSAMFDAGGALTAILDTASYVETNILNTTPGGPTAPIAGGVWYCGPGNNTAYTTDGTHPNNLGAATMVPGINLAVLGHYTRIQTSYT